MSERPKLKFRFTATVEVEYEPNTDHYPQIDPNDPDIGEMLKIDHGSMDDDPFLMLDHPDAKWEIDVIDITDQTTGDGE